MRLLTVVILSVLALAVRPVSADPGCDALRNEARAYIQTSKDIHQLVLWHRQGLKQEQWQEAWAAWNRWQADPARLLVGDLDAWEVEWISRYGATLDFLARC